MPDSLSSSSPDQLAEKVRAAFHWNHAEPNARAALAELVRRVEAAEKERDEWKLEAERRGWPKDAAQEFHRRGAALEAAEARVTELSTAIARQLTPLDVAATHLEMIERDSAEDRATVTKIVRAHLNEARKALFDALSGSEDS